jgi:hypothetical protein
MAENESFFRKVVRFVANPATDWTNLSPRTDDSKELELEKSELKAMIERKRRNDFVRKREFDVLRRVRRDGLSPEQLAALGSSSRLDDSEPRLTEGFAANPHGVKAKIDEIEQQMVGEPGFNGAASLPPSSAERAAANLIRPRERQRDTNAPTRRSELATGASVFSREPIAAPSASEEVKPATNAATAPLRMGNGLPPLAEPRAASFQTSATDALTAQFEAPNPSASASAEVSDLAHDPELDEAVIAFANADFAAAEEALQRITGNTGPRAHHAATWLVLFDLYRATSQQQRFESLAMDYAQRFGSSAPQWYSLPQMVAEAAAAEEPATGRSSSDRITDVGWVCPSHLDIEGVSRLRSQSLQLPLPWVLDWNELRSIDPEAAMQLSTLFRLWSGQPLDMRWNGGGRLFTVLHEAAPTGMRDADPVFWLTRMEALRLVNRPDQFDEAAIDYCVTYEVSPPSWETTRCKVEVTEEGQSSRLLSHPVASEMSTNFMESALVEDANTGMGTVKVELSGQLLGDISRTLERMEAALGNAQVVQVSCTRLIRVDFIAAGDLLNWVLARRQEHRAVYLMDAHRLVALFFGAMGINEHARVQVRKV